MLVRSVASGVRSSWDASATSRRCEASERSSAAIISLKLAPAGPARRRRGPRFAGSGRGCARPPRPRPRPRRPGRGRCARPRARARRPARSPPALTRKRISSRSRACPRCPRASAATWRAAPSGSGWVSTRSGVPSASTSSNRGSPPLGGELARRRWRPGSGRRCPGVGTASPSALMTCPRRRAARRRADGSSQHLGRTPWLRGAGRRRRRARGPAPVAPALSSLRGRRRCSLSRALGLLRAGRRRPGRGGCRGRGGRRAPRQHDGDRDRRRGEQRQPAPKAQAHFSRRA